MATDTVAVTGGSGKIGRSLLAHLNEHGYRTVNLNRGKRRNDDADAYLRTDLTDAGDVYGALVRADADAIVHLGMIPVPTETPGHVTFESNAMSSYHVLEAAQGLGVDTVVLASSLCAKGAGYETDPVPVHYLPMDERHPLYPSNPYALGKQAVEQLADGFARRRGPPAGIVSVRYPWVATDDELRERFVEDARSLPAIRDADNFVSQRNGLFAYVHLDDAVHLTRLAVEADVAGHERVWAMADDTSADVPTAELVAELYPDAERRTEFEAYESLFDTSKARDLLGWEPDRSWRDLP